MAETPRVITRSLKNGTSITLSPEETAGFLDSIHRKNTNNKKAMLQINVNRNRKVSKRIVWQFQCNYKSNILKLSKRR